MNEVDEDYDLLLQELDEAGTEGRGKGKFWLFYVE
jgi:hypothetical protein